METLQFFLLISGVVLFFIFLSWFVGFIKKGYESKEYFEEGTPKDIYDSFKFDDKKER